MEIEFESKVEKEVDIDIFGGQLWYMSSIGELCVVVKALDDGEFFQAIDNKNYIMVSLIDGIIYRTFNNYKELPDEYVLFDGKATIYNKT